MPQAYVTRYSINMRRASNSRCGRPWLSRPGVVVQGGAGGARPAEPAFFKRAIDLGCGTGLAAAAFAGRSTHSPASICRRA